MSQADRPIQRTALRAGVIATALHERVRLAVRRRTKSEAEQQLAEYFRRNGYVRTQSIARVSEEGSAKYKKGDEVRLVAESQAELQDIRRLLLEAGFEPGRPFLKGRQLRQPIYGRSEVARFLEMVHDR